MGKVGLICIEIVEVVGLEECPKKGRKIAR